MPVEGRTKKIMIPVSGTTAVFDSGIKPESGMGGEVGTYGCPVGLGNPGTPPLVPHLTSPVTKVSSTSVPSILFTAGLARCAF